VVLREVPRDQLTFELPAGYRLLESEHEVVLLDSRGRVVFVGSATRATPEVLLQAIATAQRGPGPAA
jgi:hypothetical protein